MKLTLFTAPADYPITLQEAKAALGIDGDDHDGRLDFLIASATEYLEDEIRLSFISRTYDWFLDFWPFDRNADPEWAESGIGSVHELISASAKRHVDLPRGPVSAVTHIKTYDDADAATTFASTNYYVDTVGKQPRIVLRTNSSWPIPLRVANGIEIRFVAGYGSNPDSVPENIRRALLGLVTHWFENPESVNTQGGATNIPLTLERTLKRLRPIHAT